jgi:hypothetical protein
MRVGRALCLFSLAHSLVRSSAVLVKPKGELLAQSLVQVLAGSLKGEFLAHSLVQVQVQVLAGARESARLRTWRSECMSERR